MKKSPFSLKEIVILLAAVLIMATTMGTVTMSLSIFYPVVSASLAVSRASFSLTSTIIALSSMFAALFWGFLYAKKPLMKPMAIAIIIFGLTFFGMQAAKNLYHFYALSLIIGLTYGGIGIIPVSIIITRHFNKNTGLALSTALAGSGFGAMILNPIINTIINSSGWRIGYQLLGISVFAITLPCAILINHLTKNDHQIKTTNEEVKSPGQNIQIKSMPWFWIYLIAAFLTGATGGAVLANLPTYLKDLNFSVSKISFITSAYAASLVIGKFILGFLYDRLGGKKASLVTALLMSLSLVLMPFITATPLLIVMLISIGIGLAIGTVTITWLTNYFFGKENYSKYYGAVQFSNSFGIAATVPLIASALENLSNPNLVWFLLTAVSLLMTALFMLSIRGNQEMKASQLILSKADE